MNLGVIGAAAVTGGQSEPEEFFLRYLKETINNDKRCTDWTSTNSECLLLPTKDFESSLVDPPKTDRATLGWSSEMKGRGVFFRYGKVGCDVWYHATVGDYDDESLEHQIEPVDGSAMLVVNLLKSKKSIVKEWRFVQGGEEVSTTLSDLNG
jgi:hypothetical protein